jgi:hypothetical protein
MNFAQFWEKASKSEALGGDTRSARLIPQKMNTNNTKEKN